MFRFAKSGSVLFQVLCWLFLASLSGDAANLDDLLQNVVALHDDADIGIACAVSAAETLLPLNSTSHLVQSMTADRLPGRYPPGGIRIVIDQDSPSLEGDGIRTGFESPFAGAAPRFGIREATTFADRLHILFRTLLI
jgi:hypothetical protein